MISTVNFQDHPTNRNTKVFYFSKTEHASHFENLLAERNVTFEKQIDSDGDQRIYYGIHISKFDIAKNLNYLTIGKFRNKFIPDLFFRYFLIIISIIVVGLGIVGGLLAD
ncbi:MAG: hypothetical protein ACJARP_002823 [Vicingaceae bacterium]|jgi:hypothetical protein